MNRLITLCFSHYSERARWALDRAGVPYVEQTYMPGFSSAAIYWATRGRGGDADRVSTRFSAPVLFLPDRTLHDSGLIARWASEQGGLGWYDVDGVDALEAEFHDRLGADTRRVVYWFAFEDDGLLQRLAERNVSRRQAVAFRWLYPLVRRRVQDGLRVTPERVERSLDRARALFDDVAERLSDGRPYLLGDRFTGADLTFACLGSPPLLVGPDLYGAVLPPIEELQPEPRALVEEFRAHPAGQFLLRLFREERRTISS